MPPEPLPRSMRPVARAESVAARAGRLLLHPLVYAALVLGIVALGLVVRLGRAAVADDILTGELPDSKQYFVNAYSLFLHGHFEPFAHRGDGWSLVLAGALRAFGFVGTSGFSMRMDAPYDDEAADAIRFAYAFSAVVSAALVPATWLVARQLAGRAEAAVAALFVALDPFLLHESANVLADTLFALLVVLAFACVLRARRQPAWLAAAGSLVALSHMVRVNGLLIIGSIVLFAALYLRRAPSHRWWHLAIPLAAFLVVAAPYLAWRDHYLPGPFDYGTNQRFWADDPWDFDDHYWQTYTYSGGGERETARDYFATHTVGEAALRFYHSGQWQLLDLTRVVLTPMLLVLGLAGMAATRKETWSPLAPILGLTLAATFAWVYPIVRAPRYFLVLIPVFAILAAIGARHVAQQANRWWLAAWAIVLPYVVTYAVDPLVGAGAIGPLLADARIAHMVAFSACALALVVLTVCLHDVARAKPAAAPAAAGRA